MYPCWTESPFNCGFFYLVGIELIRVFAMDGFVTTFSWLHVTFTTVAAVTADVLFPPHHCFLYLVIACLREDRELHPAQIG